MEAHPDFDECSVASQFVFCASCSGSFSTPKMCGCPHTPISGHSMPQSRYLLIDYEAPTNTRHMGYEFAVRNSIPTEHFPSHSKSDWGHFIEDGISVAPCRKGSMQAQQIEFDYTRVVNPQPLENQGIEFVNSEVLGNVLYPHHNLASPFAPAPDMDLNVVECDGSSDWPMDYFVNSERYKPAPNCSYKNIRLINKRRVHVGGPQYKSVALHRAQGLQEASTKRAQWDQDPILSRVIHNCAHPKCVGRKPFKRSEHLKRHVAS